MSNFNNMLSKLGDNPTIGVIGCGYVGRHLISALAHCKIIAYDINSEALRALPHYHTLQRTNSHCLLNECDVIVICVPTPLKDRRPDLTYVNQAIHDIIEIGVKDRLIIIESSVTIGFTSSRAKYIERKTGYNAGEDFYMGFSPERINPGDKEHTLENTPKIIAGVGNNSTELMKIFYKRICKNIKYASSPEIAETAKLVENTQRYVNMAYVNDIAMNLKKLNIDPVEVLNLCRTKWSWGDYKPGFVSGACIPLNPYYLMDSIGYEGLISEAKKVNIGLKYFILDIIKEKLDYTVADKNIMFLGTKYKKGSDMNCSNTAWLILELSNRGAKIDIANDADEVRKFTTDPTGYDMVVIGHAQHEKLEFGYTDSITKAIMSVGQVIDLAGLLPERYIKSKKYWRLG